MAVIHIDPLPSRVSPGEVLRFIAERGRIEGKSVGKIAFIGRGATVEVPDAKAATLVSALDGAVFRDKPIRARFAGKADFTNADHFANLSRLLDLEARAEQEEARRRAQAKEGSPVGDGVTLTRLVLRDEEFGLGGHLLLTFGHKALGTLPPTRLQPGSPVVVSQTNVNRRMPSYRGVVFDRDERTIGVAIDPPDEDLAEEGVWRLDLSSDEVSRLRQQDALQRVAAAEGDRLAELRGVLAGEREPAFAQSWRAGGVSPLLDQETGDLRPRLDQEAGDVSPRLDQETGDLRPRLDQEAGDVSPRLDQETGGLRPPLALNLPQIAAIEFAIAAKDVAIIHGPPGTGKTTTVVELIRQLVARGETLLACAPSNHAVDNLLEKLLAGGELPVRLGHPARISPELRARALDMLAEKHPDARQARKVARDAFALFRQADRWTRTKPQPGEKAALRREAKEMLAEARRLEGLAVERILDEARIICATLTGLDSKVLGQRRFTVAVIDEACQSTEPAAWVPLLRVDRVVLAGDHCQLPPTVLSNEAEGLAVSLQERLIGLHGPGIARLLTVQYRMHESIMGFSNGEFYGGELVADESVAGHRLCDLAGVRARPLTERPVQFVDTAGASYDEELEGETGSRRNLQEADLAARKVRQLLDAGLGAHQIGVIAPYRAQVRALRERLADVDELEIDSVDGFQGREKEAIIVSLVRSNPEGEIGFLGAKNQRRAHAGPPVSDRRGRQRDPVAPRVLSTDAVLFRGDRGLFQRLGRAGVNLRFATRVGALMMPPAQLKTIAHESLCLREPPYLKHYRGGRFRVWNGVSMTASSLPGPGFNFAAVLHADSPSLDDLLPVAREFFANCEQGWGILVEGDAGHRMEAELRSAGWRVDEDEPAFVLEDIGSARRQPVESALSIRHGTTDADSAAYQRVTREAFGSPADLSDAFIPGPGFTFDPDIALFIGAVDGVDVTAAGYSRSGDTAVLWGVATVESRRGKGHGSAISRAALAHAVGRGCTTASLRSGPRSIPVYERLGFRYVCRHRTYAHPA